MKKKKIFLYVLLGLIVIGLLPILGLRVWGSYRLWQTERVKTPEGLNRWEETVRIATTLPPGENLLQRPLWKSYIKEMLLVYGEEYANSSENWKPAPPRTNAISAWGEERHSRADFYMRWPGAKVKLNRAARYEDLVLLERIRKEAAKEIPDDSYMNEIQKEEKKEEVKEILKERREQAVVEIPDDSGPNKTLKERQRLLNEALRRYDVADSSLTDEQKAAAILLDYINGVQKATVEEMKKDFRECDYYGFNKETFIEFGGNKKAPLGDILLPHLSIFKALCQRIRENAHWYAILGEREKSLSELNSGLDMISLKIGSPNLMDGLVRRALVRIMLDAIQKVIQNEVLGEEDLRQIQDRISQLNMIEMLQQTLIGAHIAGESMLDLLILMPEDGSYPEDTKVPWPLILSARLAGLIQLNKASYGQTIWQFQDALDPKTQTVDYEAWKKGVEIPKGFLHLLSRNMSLGHEKLIYKFLRCQSERDTTILACALERYRLKEGSFPEKIEVLIPEYLPQMPPGSLEQGSLSYNRTEKGYELILNKLPGVTDIPPSFIPEESGVEVVWKRSRE
jgi:hypothetical protein